MYAVASLRHVYWVAFTNTYDWTLASGSFVVAYNGLISTVNTLVVTHALVYSRLPLFGKFTNSSLCIFRRSEFDDSVD